MSDREYFLETLKNELPIFERVIRAAPEDKTKLEWRPHPKNKNAWELITQTFGGESLTFQIFLKTGKIDFGAMEWPKYNSLNDVIESVKKNFEETEKMVKGMTEEDWGSKADMMADGKSVWSSTKGKMAWGMLLDLIHHRGQLSVYLRPMGAKVPSIYGPSADEPM